MKRLGQVTTLLAALVTVLVVVTGLVSVCLPESSHSVSQYDGDEDDVGIAQDRFGVAPAVVTAATIPIVYVPSPTRHHSDESAISPLLVVPRGPLVSRPPPA